LPVHLPIAVLVTAWIVELVERRPSSSRARALRTAGLAAVAVLMSLRLFDTLDKNARRGAAKEQAFLADVLKLTRPGDPVFDLKGECVFRPRGYFPVLEKITRDRLARGAMVDDCAAELARSRVVLAIADDPAIPRSGRAFLDAHFVPAGRVRVLGALLDLPPEGYAAPRQFDVAFPARFVFVGESETPAGLLDGRPVPAEALDLAPGEHVYMPHGLEGRFAVVWANAVERGWTFALAPAPEGGCR